MQAGQAGSSAIETQSLPNEDYPFQEEEALVSSQYWRLNHLYFVKNESGKKVRFRLNQRQFRLLKGLWHKNIVLKSRQHGITTAVCIFFLDCCLFNSCVEAGIIAHTDADVIKIFVNKVRFAYDNLPDQFRKAIKPSKTEAKNELHFENDSCIRVGRSMRSGTLQYLLVSEFGKICAKHPDKAQEIVTGALNTVHVGEVTIIESTAEGRAGYFYDYSQKALNNQRQGNRLTQLDWKMHFFGWPDDPKNVLSDEDARIVPIPQTMIQYFALTEMACPGLRLTHNQKAWYIKKKEDLGDKIKSEYPSTPEEAFEQQIEGAFWASEMAKVRSDGRICRVPYQPNLLVDTWWDLGLDGYMAIWFTQSVVKEIHVIEYFEFSGEGFAYYRDELVKRQQGQGLRGLQGANGANGANGAQGMQQSGYRYGTHYAPHDIETRVLDEQGRSRKAIAAGLGIHFQTIPRVQAKADSIEAARVILPLCWFDEQKCERGIIHLENYRRKWNEAMQQYSSSPVEDEHAHGADAFQQLAMGHRFDVALGGSGVETHAGAFKAFKVGKM